ncbi:MAG TPA: SpoIIE family protein phosphatase [Thermotogota bacterium]|nr:SpoIIE family protein phosphatase [Thermotogota bacterium]HPJ88319.1 SpoIIE family protein phosphatase [Thermotogota bacterium]HPR95333.1 SpoIIE family protein phosphatase [Thermotogota bacterium]
MLYFEGIIHQSIKDKQIVCGDYTAITRTKSGSYFGVFDGIGSGIYANIAATECATRWAGMIENGLSFSETCEHIAASMHKARIQEFPFTAFNAANFTNNGKCIIYTYEAPKPILIKNGVVQILEPHYYTVGYEIIGESRAEFEPGDKLLLFSDGVSQAGLGLGYSFGWGEEGLVNYCKLHMKDKEDRVFLDEVSEYCKLISGERHHDDTTLIMVNCRQPKQLSLFSGPPSKKEKDLVFANAFKNSDGKRLICGSTTADVISKGLNRKIRMKEKSLGFQSPPEYAMEGATMVTEGAMVLNQVSNILDAEEIEITMETSPERIAKLLLEADVIHFYIGNAKNKAHQMLVFRQLGIKEREEILKDIESKLKKKGKMIYWDYY